MVLENSLGIQRDVYDWLKTAGVEPITGRKAYIDKAFIVEDWVNSELDELSEGLEKKNDAEILNAFIDAKWMLHNLSYLAGLPLVKSFDTDSIFKVVNISQDYKDIINFEKMADHLINIYDEVISVRAYINPTIILNALIDCNSILNMYQNYLGYTSDSFFTEANKVRTSNFSKFCKTELEAQQSVVAYAKGTHPNKVGSILDVYYKETGNPNYPFALFQKSDNKILKSINFKDVDQL